MKALILFSSLFFLLSCSQQFQILQTTDKFAPGKKIISTTPITVKASNPFDLAELQLEFGYIDSPDTSLKFFNFIYTGEEWAFIESLKILIDGKVFKVYPSQKPKHQIMSLGLVSELMVVKIDNEIFSLMKNAQQIDMRVMGDNRSFDFSFDDELKEDFKEFVKNINE